MSANLFLPENPHDGCRTPARRWERVGYLVEEGRRPFRAMDDGQTWEAWRFRLVLENCRTEEDGEQLSRHFPALTEAHYVFQAAPPMTRAELDARLLAGQSDADIAAKVNMSPAGVAAYHAVFFEVRPHLQADTYIVNVVLGGKVHSGIDRDDHTLLLKALGYGMGGAGVDQCLDMINNPPVVPYCLEQLDLPSLKELRDKTAFQVGVLTMTTSASAASFTTWRWLRERLAAQRRGAAESDQSPTFAIRPALEAPAFAVSAQPDDVAENRQDYGEKHQTIIGRLVRPKTTGKQGKRVAVSA